MASEKTKLDFASELAVGKPNSLGNTLGGFCEHKMDNHESKAWKLLEENLDKLLTNEVIQMDARTGGEVDVRSAVHGASSLAIEGLIPEVAFPVVLSGIRRSLGITEKS